jgi:retinol dehydrogenase 12
MKGSPSPFEESPTTMSSRVAVISGANRGIGRATAKGLARAGFETVLLCRTLEKSEATVEALSAETRLERFLPAVAELTDPEAIDAAAREILDRFGQVHLLVNNAGIVNPEYRETSEGIEETLAVNHLGYVRLTTALLPGLLRGRGTRIVNVTSEAHAKTFDPSDFAGPKGWKRHRAYMQSKFLNLVFTFDLSRRLQGKRIAVNAVHPGLVATRLLEGFVAPNPFLAPVRVLTRLMGTSEAKGARTSLRVATDPILTGVTGEYFKKGERTSPPDEARDRAVQDRVRQWTAEVGGVNWSEGIEG